MEEVNKVNEVKITSVEKAKDPKRVEAGKKLGAMSRQAKEKKASQKIDDIEEFRTPSIDSINPLAVVGVVGVVGVIVYYKYFSNKDVVVDGSEKPKSKNPTRVSPKEEKPTPKRRELDSLD